MTPEHIQSRQELLVLSHSIPIIPIISHCISTIVGHYGYLWFYRNLLPTNIYTFRHITVVFASFCHMFPIFPHVLWWYLHHMPAPGADAEVVRPVLSAPWASAATWTAPAIGPSGPRCVRRWKKRCCSMRCGLEETDGDGDGKSWLVVTGTWLLCSISYMAMDIYIYMGWSILPIDFHIFQMGRYTTNIHQPDMDMDE